MFVRIVKMSFHAEHVTLFLEIFHQKKEYIRKSKGCTLLELYCDKQHSNIFFTYSYWKTAQDLENYRNSELFKNVWAKTKPLFIKKAEAWSVDSMIKLP